MIATVTEIREDKSIKALVRRNHTAQSVFGRHADVKIGDRIEVKRQVNNPYLIRVVK